MNFQIQTLREKNLEVYIANFKIQIKINMWAVFDENKTITEHKQGTLVQNPLFCNLYTRSYELQLISIIISSSACKQTQIFNFQRIEHIIIIKTK